MKKDELFYSNSLATAIVMALSAPAFAADNAVSTTPVILDKNTTTLEQDVFISNTADQQITAVTINAADKDLNVTFGGHDITAESTMVVPLSVTLFPLVPSRDIPIALPFSFFATKLPPLTATSPVESMTIAVRT